jgi:hypothetical protein
MLNNTFAVQATLDCLPLHGSSSRAKRTDASKAAAQLKKAETAQKVAAQKLLAAEAKEAAAKKTELLSKVNDFKVGVTIGVLTTGPRLQNACNDTFLQPNYYTYSNSDHGCVLDVTSQALCKLGHLVTSQYPTLTPQESRESR